MVESGGVDEGLIPMRAILYDRALRYATDHPIPVPAAGEALIRLSLAGICNTDLEITKGYMGFQGVLGHEFVGRRRGSARGPARRAKGGRRDQLPVSHL